MTLISRLCALFLLSLFFNFSLIAQDYITNLTSFQEKDGLSNNNIQWTFKDSRGVIWVGAIDGINRFDGTSFKLIAELDLYRIHDQAVFEDKEGDLWIKRNSVNSELCFFNIYTAQIKTFEEKFKQSPPFSKHRFHKAILLADQTIVIGTTGGKMIYFDQDKKFEVSEVFNSGSPVSPFTNQKADQGFWLSESMTQIEGKKPPSGNTINYYNNKLHKGFSITAPQDTSYYLLGCTADNSLVYSDFTRVYKLDTLGNITLLDLEALSNEPFDSFKAENLVFDEVREIFWYGNLEKLYSFGKNKPIQQYDFQREKGLLTFDFNHYLIQKNGIWIATTNGLSNIQVQPTLFHKTLYQIPSKKQPELLTSTRGITSDEDGNVYISSIDGIYKKSAESLQLFSILDNPQPAFNDSRGHLWTSTAFAIHQIDMKSGEIKDYPIQVTDSLNYALEAWSLYMDKSDRIWMGSRNGLSILANGEDTVKLYDGYSEIDQRNKHCYAFYTDQENQVWMLTTFGLLQFDANKGSSKRYWKGGDTNHYLPVDDLRHMVQDREGIYWIASSEGLLRWDKKNKETRLFTKSDGLSANMIYAVFEDDFGFLWMSSDQGIMQFEKSTFKVKNFMPSEGLTHREFNRISHHQDRNGNIYFGGLNGVTYFHPKNFHSNFDTQPDIPLLLLECDLFSGKQNQQIDQLAFFNENKKLILHPGDKYLRLQFALLDYPKGHAVEYAYAINPEEADENWSISKDNAINISGLAYGEHTLVIKGKPRDGIYSKNNLVVPITVLKPFYLQTWFLACALFLLIAGIFILQKIRTHKLIERQVVLENTVAERTKVIQAQTQDLLELDKAKSRFFANISHEFRTPLTLILNTMDQELVGNIVNHQSISEGRFFGKEEIDILQRNARRLEKLIGQLLDLSKSESKKLELEATPGDFYQYLKNTINSFKPLARKENIDLQFMANVDRLMLSFDRDKMDKIVFNLLSNAIKFTEAGGLIKVDLRKENQQILVQIEDTGIGITSEDLPNIFDRFYQVQKNDNFTYEGMGLGLALVREFVELHHGKISVQSEINQGTSFLLDFPLQVLAVKEDSDVLHNNKNTYFTETPEINNSSLVEPVAEKNAADATDLPILLIIEDNADLRFFQQKKFSDHYQVHLAADGKEGQELAFSLIPDLIISDIMMPKVNGYELCELLKKDERTNHIPIILLTAKAGQQEKLQGLSIGADAYITKPYDQRELTLRIRNILTLKDRLREQYQIQLKVEQSKTPLDPFVQKVIDLIEERLTDRGFGVEQLSSGLHMSRSQLFRKLKALTNETPTNFLRSYRLRKAHHLLETKEARPSEVFHFVGFSSSNYFFKCFKDEYGMTPSEMLNLQEK